MGVYFIIHEMDLNQCCVVDVKNLIPIKLKAILVYHYSIYTN